MSIQIVRAENGFNVVVSKIVAYRERVIHPLTMCDGLWLQDMKAEPTKYVEVFTEDGNKYRVDLNLMDFEVTIDSTP